MHLIKKNNISEVFIKLNYRSTIGMFLILSVPCGTCKYFVRDMGRDEKEKAVKHWFGLCLAAVITWG